MYDLTIITCSYGAVESETNMCIENLRDSPLKFRWVIRSGDALISRSRSVEASNFLKLISSYYDAPYMLFLDGDIIFTNDDVLKIYDGLRSGMSVIGGMYPVGDGSRLAHCGWNGQLAIDGKPQELEYLSTGFMGISRDILQRIRDQLNLPLLQRGDWSECWPFFEAVRSKPERGLYLSEDWDFCEKVRAVGDKIWCHTGVYLRHKKYKVYSAQEAIEHTKAPEADTTESVIEDLVQYTGKDLAFIYTNNWRALMEQKFQARSGTPEEFYATEPDYIFDLATWHAQNGYKKTKLEPLSQVRNLKILDFGCGIGTAVLDLAHRNIEVVGYDVNKPSIDFANFRKNKYRAHNVSFITELPLDLTSFDVIVAIDVFEHILDLPGTLKDLSNRMRLGSKLYHNDNFKDVYALHFDHSNSFYKWVSEAGFLIWDDNWLMKVRVE